MQERRQVMELQQREPMEDGKIVELYWNRDEKAIEETDFKYKKYARLNTKGFLRMMSSSQAI